MSLPHILRLKWDQVDLGKTIITFKEQKKNDRMRIKFLNGDMINLLFEIKQKNLLMGIEPEDIFLGPELGCKGNKRPGKPVKCIRRAFQTALKNAGIKDFHFHDTDAPI